MKLEQSRVDNIIELVGALKLTPRQIQEAFRILGHIFSTSEENKGRLQWCLAVGSILMAVLKIGAPRVFHLLGSQRLEPKEAADFLKQLTSIERIVVWWFLLFYTGGGLLTEKEEPAEEIMKRAGLGNEEEYSYLRQNPWQWQEGWGHSSSRLSEIHAMIEQISQWK